MAVPVNNSNPSVVGSNIFVETFNAPTLAGAALRSVATVASAVALSALIGALGSLAVSSIQAVVVLAGLVAGVSFFLNTETTSFAEIVDRLAKQGQALFGKVDAALSTNADADKPVPASV